MAISQHAFTMQVKSELQHPSHVTLFIHIIFNRSEQNEQHFIFTSAIQYFFACSDFMKLIYVSETATHNVIVFANFSLFFVSIDSGKAVIYVIKCLKPFFSTLSRTHLEDHVCISKEKLYFFLFSTSSLFRQILSAGIISLFIGFFIRNRFVRGIAPSHRSDRKIKKQSRQDPAAHSKELFRRDGQPSFKICM